MASYNKVLLMGNLTRDPELRHTGGGTAACAIGLACNRKFTTAQGEERDEVCFVDVEVMGKQAESCKTYLHKGNPVFIEGRLRFDQWDDKATGKKRSRLLVQAERVQFLSGPARERTGGDGDGYQGGAPQPQQQYQRQSGPSAQAHRSGPPPMPVVDMPPSDGYSDGEPPPHGDDNPPF